MLRILHTISSIDLSGGGPSKSVSDLALNQAFQNHKPTIFTKSSGNPYLMESFNENLELVFSLNKSFKEDLYSFLKRNKIDILHGHGIWQMPVHFMVQIARKKKIPYIITPRGMLEPWALKAGEFKKKLALALYQRKDLAGAACIHATAKMEADQIRKLGFKNPIAVIPNGIDLNEFPAQDKIISNKKNTILFLSRIHPKKGIELLIQSWKCLDKKIRKNWHIEIAGNGEQNYIDSLQRIINIEGLTNEIKIIGPQFGDLKLETYSRADLFVLPTYSENFGVVVAEALACGVPVITTKGAPWHELETYSAGWWIDIGIKPLVIALEEALMLNSTELQQMGINGRKLVQEKYSIESVAVKTIEMYKWILGTGNKPAFILE